MKVYKNIIDNIIRNKRLNDGGFYNDNSQGVGRFANHFIRDLACSLISSKNNTKFYY